MTCTAKIRPFPNPTELSCKLDDGHDGAHVAELRDYAYPGSLTTVDWLEDDRRTFHGEWPGFCGQLSIFSDQPCPLPQGHPRDHVA